MKINKLISLDYELAEKLKRESNASKLINDLLIQHYSGGANTKENMKKTLIEQNQLIKDAQKKISKIEPKLEKLNQESSKPRLLSQMPYGSN